MLKCPEFYCPVNRKEGGDHFVFGDDYVHAAIFAKAHLIATFYHTRSRCSPKQKKGHRFLFGRKLRLQGLSNAFLTLFFGLFWYIFGLIKNGHALSGILLLQIW